MILPEIEMTDPVFGWETNSCSKFRNCMASTRKRVRDLAITRLPWPAFVYDQYDVEKTMTKLREVLNSIKIGLSSSYTLNESLIYFGSFCRFSIETFGYDSVALSFWCARNVALCLDDRIKLFINNSVTNRMLIIGQSLNAVSVPSKRFNIL